MRLRAALATAALAAAFAVPAGAGDNPGVWSATLQATQGFDHLSAFANGTFYAQYVDSYMRSRDAGATWQAMPRPPRQYLGSPGIRFATPMVGWSVTSTGVGLADVAADAQKFAAEITKCGGLTPLHRTVDGGTTWSPVCVPGTRPTSNPYFSLGGSPLAVGRDGRTIMLTGSESRGGVSVACGESTDVVYSTRDAGATWSKARLPVGWSAGYRSQVLDSSTMAHLAYYFEEGVCESSTVGLFVSRDGGKTFRKTYVCRTHPVCTSLAMVTRSRIILGRSNGATLVSNDAGRTWRSGQRLFETAYQPAIDTGKQSPHHFWAQAMSFVDARHGYASTRGSGTWRTTDGGVSWTQERSHECVLFVPGIGEIAAGSPSTAITGGPHFISARVEVPVDNAAVEGCTAKTGQVPDVLVTFGDAAIRADGTSTLRR